MSASNILPITIPAAAGGRPGVFTVNYRASVFHCLATTADFEVQPDNAKPVEATAGRGFGTPAEAGGRVWTRLTLINRSVTPIVTTIYQGLVAYSGEQILAAQTTVNVISTNKNADTYNKNSTALLTTGATANFTGLDGTKKRKSISIFNANPIADPTDILEVRDGNAVVGHEVDPRQSAGWETGGVVNIRNASANSVRYRVVEVFYA